MKSTSDRRSLAGLAGMLGAALFVAVFTIEGWLRPGYNSAGAFISELSIGPRGWVQIANFVVLGALFLVFAWGVRDAFRDGRASKWGVALLTVIGVSFLASGPFVTDLASTPPEQMSTAGIVHGIFGAVVFSLAPVSCFVFWRRFRTDPAWRGLAPWTLAAGIVTTAAVILLSAATKTGAANALTPWSGSIQRAVIVPYLAWVFAFAFALRGRA